MLQASRQVEDKLCHLCTISAKATSHEYVKNSVLRSMQKAMCILEPYCRCEILQVLGEKFEGVELNIGQVCRTVTDGEKESQCCGIFLVVKKKMVINSDHIPLQLVH